MDGFDIGGPAALLEDRPLVPEGSMACRCGNLQRLRETTMVFRNQAAEPATPNFVGFDATASQEVRCLRRRIRIWAYD